MSIKRVLISSLLRRLARETQISDTAATFVKQYLKPYLRDEILEEYDYQGLGEKEFKGRKKGLEIGNIIAGAMKKAVGSPSDKQRLFEDIAFDFSRPMKNREQFVGATATDIRAALTQVANKKLGLGKRSSEKLIERGGGTWDNNDRENFEDLREDFIKVTSSYLANFFQNAFVNILKKKEDPLAPSQAALLPDADKETQEFIKDFDEFSEKDTNDSESKAIKSLGFKVEDLKDFIKENPKVKEKKLYMTVLEDNILKSGPAGKKKDEGLPGYKSYVEIAEELDLDDPKEKGRKKIEFVGKQFKKLINTLRAQRGLNEKEGTDMEASLPYSIIRNIEAAETDERSPIQVKYKRTEEGDLERLKKELAKEEAITDDNRNLNKIKRLTEEVAEASKKDEDLEVEGSSATKSHVKIIENALDRHKVKAIIEFSANYDNKSVLEKNGPDPKKDPVDFKYKKYTASFRGVRKGSSKKGGWKKTVNYTYTQDLTDEGDPKGESKSTLELDGNPVPSTDNFKKSLDDHVKNNMLTEGMLPYGQSVGEGKSSQLVKFPVVYENVKMDETYFGAEEFFRAYQGLLTEDISQKKRKEIVEKKQRQRSVGRSTEEELKKTIKMLENELESSPDERSTIEKEIVELKKNLKNVEDISLEDETEDSLLKSVEWLLKKNKTKLEKAEEDYRVENTLPAEEKDPKNLRNLDRKRRNLEEYVKELEEDVANFKKKTAFLVPIATHLRNIHAVSEEWKQKSRELQKAEDSLENLKTVLKTTKDKVRIKVKVDKQQELVDKLKKDMESEGISKGAPGAFPETDSEDVKEFYKIFSDAGVQRFPKMTLYGWLTAIQLKQVAKQLQAVLRTKYDELIKDAKAQKGKEPEEREKMIEDFKKEHKADLEKASKLMKALPADLKKRRDKFKTEHPSDFGRIKDPEWVDSPEKVKDALESVSTELSDIKGAPSTGKQETINTLELNKFKGLGNFLSVAKSGLGTLAKRLMKAPLEPGPMPADLNNALTQYVEKSESNFAKAQKMLSEATRDVGKDSEAAKALEKMEEEFKDSKKDLAGAKNIMTHFETTAKQIPALAVATALVGKGSKESSGALGYFATLYNFYSSILYFGEKGHLPTGEARESAESFTQDDIADLKEIRDDAVEAILTLAATPMDNKKEIKRELAIARKGMKKFVESYSDYDVPDSHVPKSPGSQIEHGRQKREVSVMDPKVLQFREKRLKDLGEELKTEKAKQGTPEYSIEKIRLLEDEEKLRQELARMDVKLKQGLGRREQGALEDEMEKKVDEIDAVREKFKKIADPEKKTASLPYSIITSAEDKEKPKNPGYEKLKETAIFPEDKMSEIQKLLVSLKNGKKDVETAEKELAQVKKDVKERHDKSNSKEELAKLYDSVKVENGSTDAKDFESQLKRRALEITRKVVDKINRDALNAWITKWENVREDIPGDMPDQPYLNRKDPKVYEDMWEYLKEQLPEKQYPGLVDTPPEEATKEVMGKPTDKKVREYYEEAFSDMKLDISDATVKDIANIYQNKFEDRKEGGGGGSSKGRSKPIKNNPPKITYEKKKEELLKHYRKSSNGHTVIMNILNDYLLHLKKQLKGGDQFYTGKVVDYMINMLKSAMSEMAFITVGPPWTQGKLPIKGSPASTGHPDIMIQTDKDAEDVYNKMKQMMRAINDFTAPDMAPIPGKKLTDAKGKEREFFPSGLMRWYDKPEAGSSNSPMPEIKDIPAKKSSTLALAYNLAQKFSSVEVAAIDNLSEEDLMSV